MIIIPLCFMMISHHAIGCVWKGDFRVWNVYPQPYPQKDAMKYEVFDEVNRVRTDVERLSWMRRDVARPVFTSANATNTRFLTRHLTTLQPDMQSLRAFRKHSVRPFTRFDSVSETRPFCNPTRECGG